MHIECIGYKDALQAIKLGKYVELEHPWYGWQRAKDHGYMETHPDDFNNLNYRIVPEDELIRMLERSDENLHIMQKKFTDFRERIRELL